MRSHSRPRAIALITLALLLSLSMFGQVFAAPPDSKGKQSGVQCPVAGGAQVVLDPGHGGSDTGAYNATYKLVERDLNLDIAFRTQQLLWNAGYSVALTRYDNATELGSTERGEIANACGADVLILIHLNGSSDPSINYTQTFWGKKRKDLEFSQVMSGAMDMLGIPNNGAGQFANGALLHATMPSTLLEAVFLTNDEEGAMLAAGTRQDEIAAAITQGVKNWVRPWP